MSFDQNMIIDATKGSIARFVNHSCRPNCRMVKWIVGGKPRMALFAGDKPIMSGDELTYDYNFDPFSAKNVQECLCGSDNCRGVLGPRPKDQKLPKDNLKDTVKASVKAGKRKFKKILGVEDDKHQPRLKKRKMIQAKGKKRPSAAVPTPKKSISIIKKKVSARVVGTGSTIRSTAAASNLKKGRKPAGLKKYSVVSKRTQKVLSTERTSPRSKARRSYREYLEKNRQEKTFAAKVGVKPIGKGLQSLQNEESNTIRVLTNADL
jgi:histone-lysine N-methyltransferase ASH1L